MKFFKKKKKIIYFLKKLKDEINEIILIQTNTDADHFPRGNENFTRFSTSPVEI